MAIAMTAVTMAIMIAICDEDDAGDSNEIEHADEEASDDVGNDEIWL